MQQSFQAIVLRQIKYSDKSNIVTLYTQERGRISALIPAQSSRKAKVSRNLFQPLFILDLVYTQRTSNGIGRIVEAKLHYPAIHIMTDPSKMSLVLFLGEFLYGLLQEESGSHSLFVFLTRSIQWLDTSEKSIANFHLAFLLRLMHFVGITPNLEDYVPSAYFDLRDGAFVALRPLHQQVIYGADLEKLVSVLRMTYNNMHLYKMSRSERRMLLQLILDYYQVHYSSLQELHSLKIMQELFD